MSRGTTQVPSTNYTHTHIHSPSLINCDEHTHTKEQLHQYHRTPSDKDNVPGYLPRIFKELLFVASFTRDKCIAERCHKPGNPSLILHLPTLVVNIGPSQCLRASFPISKLETQDESISSSFTLITEDYPIPTLKLLTLKVIEQGQLRPSVMLNWQCLDNVCDFLFGIFLF